MRAKGFVIASCAHAIGYTQTLKRSFDLFESFAASFAAVYVFSGLRFLFSTSIAAGGPAAYWSSYIICVIFTLVTAAVLAEICSALPAAGSVYLWAASSGGLKYGRFFGFLTAWWAITAWATFVASLSQVVMYFALSELTIFDVESFPQTPTDIKFRAVVWIGGQIVLAVMIGLNLVSPGHYKFIFRFATAMIMLDFFLNLIWLPIGVNRTYGFQSAKFVFTKTYNKTGASPVWNWMLSFFATGGALVGFDASGHIAEETHNASLVAARGVFLSALMSCQVEQFFIIVTSQPDVDQLFALDTPQPIVQFYALSLGQHGHVLMNVNGAVSTVAASRLVYAIARDGILPFSGYIRRLAPNGQPRNAIFVIWGVGATLLFTILGSPVAFNSLVSAAGMPTFASWALIACMLGRAFITPNNFKNPRWSLGKFSRPFRVLAFIYTSFMCCVLCSPLQFPVTIDTFNFCPIIFLVVTILAVISWWLTPEDNWLEKRFIQHIQEDKLLYPQLQK
ncbi:Thiamine transporter thi9 [Neolecta irregularis DAH-3]|uniref:Thiamine transporter thi9 n=1 Tax=Neolecta irregularis (strain DAH-3) TaxID=1198029 RepID=A0A1U7LQR7_NEOID|nr:Thiamine transporter thi9 [Neolecta irregularis DAH-3]|eukprot:OLL25016.1 Thiamine transporter thi9 [Neolecta irregularis DAH-3]